MHLIFERESFWSRWTTETPFFWLVFRLWIIQIDQCFILCDRTFHKIIVFLLKTAQNLSGRIQDDPSSSYYLLKSCNERPAHWSVNLRLPPYLLSNKAIVRKTHPATELLAFLVTHAFQKYRYIFKAYSVKNASSIVIPKVPSLDSFGFSAKGRIGSI